MKSRGEDVDPVGGGGGEWQGQHATLLNTADWGQPSPVSSASRCA